MEQNNEEKAYYTFGFIKPDDMEHKEEIIRMIQNKELRFVYCKYITLTEELIRVSNATIFC